MDKERERLISIVVAKLGWGPVPDWQGGDFRKLNQLIFEQTRVNISESTLRRVFGKSDYPHMPNETTLNTIAIFAGYAGWRAFRSQYHATAKPKLPARKKMLYTVFTLLLLSLAGAIVYRYRDSEGEAPTGFVFTSRPVTRTIPNSVIFHYIASIPNKPIFIQQSWDPQTRVRVSPTDDTYASVYYRPGFYRAKLIAGNQVVKEHALMIPTTGWLGLIADKPRPFYLKGAEFTGPDRYEITPATFAAHGLKMEPHALRAELHNVGNFAPVPVAGADFSALVKSDKISGDGVCGLMEIYLITDGVPISMQLSDKGCIAALVLFNGRALVSGKTADLSGFGVERGRWTKTEVKTYKRKLQLLVNDQMAYEASLPPASMKILGIAFGFYGGGAVKSILLKSGDFTVFKDR